MRIGNLAAPVLLVFAAFIVTAGAEEKFGVKVFDGATYDDGATQFLIKNMKLDAACYRTNAPVAQVNEFYKKQPGLSMAGETKTGAMFTKDKIHVTTQSPWTDTTTGARNKDTLISIVKIQ
jgi:hypothetical protein